MTALKLKCLEKLFPRSLHLSYEIGARRAPYGNAGNWKREHNTMSAFIGISDEMIGAVEMSKSGDRDVAAWALGIVRDGVITGEGPTTRGRIHFSRALDAQDAAWCAHILTAMAAADQPVSRAEAEALFEINAAATERSDNGRFDDLFARAIVHHATSASGLPVPSRTIALSLDTAIESWAPTRAIDLDIEVREWIASQMSGKFHGNRNVMKLVAAIIGTATLPLTQLPSLFDMGM
jgi:hypothetical protein